MHKSLISSVISCLVISGCSTALKNNDDPFESINRPMYRFNMGVDTILFKPVAKIYQAVLPQPIRTGIYNAYNNAYMMPTVANDLLQAKPGLAFQDSARFIINTTLGIGGLFDVATQMHIPTHYNDLGLTFAQYGVKHSPFLMLPLLGPSTVRDTIGSFGDYTLFSPLPYIDEEWVINGILLLHFVDARARFLETEAIMDSALDKYAFVRDAYLQNRQSLITGQTQDTVAEDSGELYVDE